MKKLLILALVLLVSNSYAQKMIDTSTYAKKVEYLFQHIEKPKNAGIWYDRVMPWANLQNFGTEKNKHSSATLFKQAYYELLIANDKKEQFTTLQNALLRRKAVGTIPLGLINAQIYFVDSNAIKNGVLVQRGENMPFSKEKAGQVFQQKHILLAALLNEKPLKANKNYQIELSTDFFLQHSSKNISQIVLTTEGK
jgi:hypothetical protein